MPNVENHRKLSSGDLSRLYLENIYATPKEPGPGQQMNSILFTEKGSVPVRIVDCCVCVCDDDDARKYNKAHSI